MFEERKGVFMKQDNVVKISQYRETKDTRKYISLSAGKKGRVYSRGGRLWVDFYYLGARVREPSGLKDTQSNRHLVRKQLDLVTAEIQNGIFEFAKRFPHSKKRSTL